MNSSRPVEGPVTLGHLVRQRLREVDRSPAELAEALRVPTAYVNDLIAGRRQPPLPGRTDLYRPMTTFLKVGRDDLATCAARERTETAPAKATAPTPKVRRLLLDMCEPSTAHALERRRGKGAKDDLTRFFQRLLDHIQVAVLRILADQMNLRLAAKRSGQSYVDKRMEVLEFLDTTPATLNARQVTRYMVPRIAKWDVDLDTGVLRVVLRSQDKGERERRGGCAPTTAPKPLPWS